MGKRKSSKKPEPKKKQEKLSTVFCCPFCNHENSVECRMDRKDLIGEASCRICQESFSTSINAFTEYTIRCSLGGTDSIERTHRRVFRMD